MIGDLLRPFVSRCYSLGTDLFLEKTFVSIFWKNLLDHEMDRINRFLSQRPRKHEKNVRYKNKSYTVTKEDLKLIRAYRSGRCLDPCIKNIPNRDSSRFSEPIQPLLFSEKKDASLYFNNKLKNHYLANPRPKVIRTSVNEIGDIWEDEGFDSLRSHTQEWIYSIDQAYEGRVEDLQFTKDHLQEELRRVYMRHFRPRDPRSKPIRDILPKLPKIEDLKPFPEIPSSSWDIDGKKTLFNYNVCSILENRVVVRDLRYNKVLVDYTFEEPILKAHMDGCSKVVVSSRHRVYSWSKGEDRASFRMVIESSESIRDVYIDKSFVGYLTSKSIVLHDSETFAELKILKLKGDSPQKIKIINNTVYASTHKGIMVESEEKTEIRNLGYVVDFAEKNGSIYAVNNLSRLIVVDSDLRTAGNTVQGGIGSQIKLHPVYDLLAIVFSNEIGIYKVVENQCLPINTIDGSFRSIDWDSEMPWLYASGKGGVTLFT